MYNQFFHLREMPFAITPDPAYLYMSQRHQEALGHLLYGTGQQGGFVQLTGEVGTGKTTIVRTLLEQKLHGVDVAMVHNPRQSELEFVQSICDELQVKYPPSPTLKMLVDALNAYLLRTHAEGRRTVLIIDEAQNLRPEVLEQVRLLTNLETAKEKLLRIMLVGQPELSDLLARADLRQLAQRITARFHLTPLSVPETNEYIQHRLRVAGAQEAIFSQSACVEVYRHARGIPRLINIICDRALLGAYSQGARKVTPAIVRKAAREAMGELPTTFDPRAPRRWAMIEVLSATALVLCTLAFVYTFFIEPRLEPAQAATVPVTPSPANLPEPALIQNVALRPADPLQALRDPQPLALLLNRLAQLWSPAITLPEGSNPCEALQRERLECFRGSGSWEDLGHFNRPAILPLALPGHPTEHYLLRELDTTHAAFESQAGLVRIPLSALEGAWNGDYLLLWRREIPETSMAIGMRSGSVPLIWERLAQLDGIDIPPEVGTYFGPKLEAALQGFQRRRGLPATGLLDVRTLIALGEADAKTPTLLSSRAP